MLTTFGQQRVVDHLALAKSFAYRYSRTDDEAVSVAFYALCRASEGYDGSSAFTTYASAAIINALNAWVKKRGLVEDVDVENVAVEDDNAIEDLIENSVDPEIVRYLYEGYSQADIARMLGVHRIEIHRRILKVRNDPNFYTAQHRYKSIA